MMISGIILASGFSRRMAEEKLLLPVGGLPLAERVMRAAKASRLHEIILVYRNEQLKELGERYAIGMVRNDRAAEGQSAAVKLGVEAAHPGANAFMFLVADQPFLTPAVIDILIDEYMESPRHIIVPFYNGQGGNPTIFPSEFRTDLLNLSGDSGGKTIIARNGDRVKRVDIYDTLTGVDIDTEEDYEATRGQV